MNIKSDILDPRLADKIQKESMELFKSRAQRYIGIDNSSITKENANMIVASNIYTINVYMNTLSDIQKVDALNKKSITEIYNEGRKIINRKLKVAKMLYKKVRSNMLDVENETYIQTINGGIKGFFKIYDPDYNANDMRITADYPLYNSLVGKIFGIEFVENYLESLYYENEFCNMFKSEDIKHLLLSYSPDYKDMIINIFKIVLMQAVGCNIIGKDYTNLSLLSEDIQKIYDEFDGKSKNEIYEMIYNSIKNIECTNQNIVKYIEKNIEEVQFEIYNIYGLQKLENIFIIQKFI